MTDIQPKYFDHTDPCLSYLEYTAIKRFAFNGRAGDVFEAFDCYRKSMVWTEAIDNGRVVALCSDFHVIFFCRVQL